MADKVAITSEAPSKKLKEGLSLVTPPEESKAAINSDVNDGKSTVSITVVGASGDLAKKKIFPALFALYYEDCLPEVCILANICLLTHKVNMNCFAP